MKLKKIIIVAHDMFGGGAERVIAQLANYFDSIGICCKIVTMNKAEVLYKLNDSVEVIPIGKKCNNKLVDKIARYTMLRKTVKGESPDVVLAMPEEVGVYVILALLGTKISVYVSERNNPWVMPDRKITRLLRRLMYPFSTGLIFQTQMAKSFFNKKIQQKGIILQNPVEENRIPEKYSGKRDKVIVGAGRLNKQKNFPMLISAFGEFSKKHPEYSLKIYGEGELRQELEEQILKLGLSDKVELPGRKNNLLEIINCSAMFVLSSDYEGMPNVLLEAMCMGMPVISTDCPSGGPREIIEDGKNGLLIPVNDQNAMVDAMEKLSDTAFAEELSEHAYLLREKLTSSQVFKEWYDFLFQNLDGI